MTNHCGIARQALEHWFAGHRHWQPELRFQRPGACFVSLHQIDGKLRGCIGTLEPVTADLALEIARNARSAALQDPRFAPLDVAELSEVSFEVSVLDEPTPCAYDDLDPQVFGLVVRSGSRRGVLLPNIPGIDDRNQQIAIAKRKAGIASSEEVDLFRFRTVYYHE